MDINIQISLLQLVISSVAILLSAVALFISIGMLWATIYPIFKQKKDKKILVKKFNQGPYDEATIELSTKYFIRPKCSNIDPGFEKEMRHALVATKEELFDKVDYFLQSSKDRRHLLILADSGMGKTTFMLNYFAYNSKKKSGKSHNISLVPLGIEDADSMIDEIPNKKNTAILLDAFDEDTKAIVDHHQRIRELMSKCSEFRRIIITCRTQFFPKDEEIPIDTGVVRVKPRKAGEKRTYEFWKLYLSPFDDEDVKLYLNKRFPIFKYKIRKRAVAAINKIPLLSVRPMLLAYIPDILKKDLDIKFSYQLYEIMVDAWLDRESDWVDKDALRKFSELLAVNLFINREQRGMERIDSEELNTLASEWAINIPGWKIRSRSLLNRNAQGQYKFAHRSIMEYLFVLRLLQGDEECLNVSLTDQMAKFLCETILTKSSISESTSNYLCKINFTLKTAEKIDKTIVPTFKFAMNKSYLPGQSVENGDHSKSYLNAPMVNDFFFNKLELSDLGLIKSVLDLKTEPNHKEIHRRIEPIIKRKIKNIDSKTLKYFIKLFIYVSEFSTEGFELLKCQKELIPANAILITHRNKRDQFELKFATINDGLDYSSKG